LTDVRITLIFRKKIIDTHLSRKIPVVNFKKINFGWEKSITFWPILTEQKKLISKYGSNFCNGLKQKHRETKNSLNTSLVKQNQCQQNTNSVIKYGTGTEKPRKITGTGFLYKVLGRQCSRV